MGHMDPDLMGPPGGQGETHQTAAVGAGQHFVFRLGGKSVGANRTADGRALFPTDGGVDHAGAGRENPFAHRQIDPLKSRGVQRLFQLFVRVGVLGGAQQPRRALVQPVHRSENGTMSTLVVIIYDKIPQRIGIVARTGVHGHAGGLVQNQNILVFIYDVQRSGRRGDVPHCIR